MDYLRWWVKKNFGKDPSVIFPMLILGLMLTGIICMFNVIVGVVVGIIVLSVFGTLIYIIASTAFKKSYADYQQETKKP